VRETKPIAGRGWWRNLGLALLVGTVLLFLIDAYEVYFLTLTRGPQMVYFTMVHMGGPYLYLFMIGVLAFHLHALFVVVVLLMRWFGRIGPFDRLLRVSVYVFAAQALHFLLMLTYDSWSYGLFGTGT
jgi:hypothetical protein